MFRHNIFQSKVLMLIASFLAVCLLGMSSFSVYAQLDDPTRPPGYRLIIPGQKKVVRERTYSLSLVQISPIRRSAVVNDRFVEVGDMINGAKVIAIYSSSVKLKKKGKVFTVELLSQNIKKTNVH